MPRYINGKLVQSSEDKRKAVEDAGGTYNQRVEGDYVEGRDTNRTESNQAGAKKTSNPRNYVENLGGKKVERWF